MDISTAGGSALMSVVLVEGGAANKLSGTQCCAIGCQKRQKSITAFDYTRSDSEGSDDEESEIKRQFPRTFHRFPCDKRAKKKWIVNIRRKGWLPSKSSVICSDHFPERFMYRLGRRVTLREGAVPTRFKKFPEYYVKGLAISPISSSSRPGIIIPYIPDTVIHQNGAPPSEATEDQNYNAPPRKIQCSTESNAKRLNASKTNLKQKQFKSCRLRRSEGKTLDEVVKRCLENKTCISEC